MAAYSAQRAVHKTLTLSVVDTVTLTGCPSGIIRITNASGSPIYYTVGTQGNPPADPTVAGDNTYLCPASLQVEVANGMGKVVVKLISAAAQAYSVEALSGLN